MTLEGAQILMAKLLSDQRMAVGGEKSKQSANLGAICANRVRTAVGFELKPSQVFIGGGLQGEWHVEAELMIMDEVGALRVVSPQIEEVTGDGFGFDRDFTERVKNVALWFYRKYWRVETDGVTNVPARGRALLVANHAGIIPYDGAMIRTAILAEHPHPRHARMLVVDWAFAMPFTNMLLVKTGNVLAHPDNATALLERDELVGVFPEGVKGASKPYRNRYRIGRFGRGGFVQVALRTGAPIIPVAVVGSEEIHPVITDLQPLARLLGLPAVPITPTFPWLGLAGLIPLPSKWLIAFGKPIEVARHGPDASSDARLVLEISDQVRDWIQSTVRTLLSRRQSIFF